MEQKSFLNGLGVGLLIGSVASVIAAGSVFVGNYGTADNIAVMLSIGFVISIIAANLPSFLNRVRENKKNHYS
ncbi:hypothetical protein GQS78_03315 [Thermococcus bergensis]|uniref:hypothetical protein n=1 Tax=Thermococcus bergensis TaxID=2689387 RepID=UPI001CED6371|nr:hypothetical protein [Thermococcus bergensis]MCA6213318.1 hypothetical protein [Thermococcus bergensis]